MKKFILKSKLVCTLVMIITIMCTFAGCGLFLPMPLESSETEDFFEYYTEDTEYEQSDSTYDTDETEISVSDTILTEFTETESISESKIEELSVEKDGRYTTPEDVAEYIHMFGTLPSNFITKKEARELGWDSKAGNLWEVTDHMSIGGDHFGNYEGLLPEADGRKYTECDVNYEGGYRGSERIIFSNDGLIFYTNDHYESFTQLY